MSDEVTPTEVIGAGPDPENDGDAESAVPAKRTLLIIAALAGAAMLAIAGIAIAVSVNGSSVSPPPTTTPSSTITTDTPSPTSAPTSTPEATDTAAPPATGDPVPVDIDKPADIVPGLTASIDSIEAVQGEASGPGEVAGPSIRFDVTVVNETSGSADLTSTVVTVYYGDADTPASELRKPGGSPLPARVAAGSSATGTYIFSVPDEERGLVRIMVDYSVGVEPLVFEGSVP